MMLTIYNDDQFWIGVIELPGNKKLKAYRYVFGKEPKNPEVLEFVNHRLLDVIDKNEQLGITDKRKSHKKVNPKRLQRQAAKEMQKKGVSTKAQEAIKKDMEKNKKESKKLKKKRKDAFKQRKWEIKHQKPRKNIKDIKGNTFSKLNFIVEHLRKSCFKN